MFDTLKGRLGLERRETRTLTEVYARVGAKLLAFAAGIRHNWLTDASCIRPLAAYGHEE